MDRDGTRMERPSGLDGSLGNEDNPVWSPFGRLNTAGRELFPWDEE